MKKISEDSAVAFTSADPSLLGFLIPKMISMFSHDSWRVREGAIFVVNQFLALRSNVLMQSYFDSFLTALFSRANDSNPEVRKRVCQSLGIILDARPEAILQQLDPIVSFMLHVMETDQESISLEACEFWLSFAEQPDLRDQLEAHVPKYVNLI